MKSSLMRTLSAAVDYYTGRYQCFIAKEDEVKTCLSIRKAVFGDELKRNQIPNLSPALPDSFDELSTHIGCRDTKSGEIIGAVRMTKAVHFKNNDAYFKEYGLKLFDPSMLESITIPSRLAVMPEHRQAKIVGMLLATKCYEVGIDDYLISCMVCEPNLFPMYRRLGYRPLSRVHTSPFGGFRLPLFLVTHDYSHLERAHSPFYRVAKERGFPERNEGKEWLIRFSLEHGTMDPGFSVYESENSQQESFPLAKNLSPQGRAALLKNAVQIRCRYGEKVMVKNDGGRNIALVQRGAVEVHRDGKVRAVLGEGDTFGEVAFLLGVPRTASIISTCEETEVLFLSLSAIEKITRLEDQVAFWKNLASLVAAKLNN